MKFPDSGRIVAGAELWTMTLCFALSGDILSITDFAADHSISILQSTPAWPNSGLGEFRPPGPNCTTAILVLQ